MLLLSLVYTDAHDGVEHAIVTGSTSVRASVGVAVIDALNFVSHVIAGLVLFGVVGDNDNDEYLVRLLLGAWSSSLPSWQLLL